MRLLLASLLLLLGMVVMLYGIGNALLELTSLYQGALTDPLKETPGGEKALSERMIRFLVIGLAGLPFSIIGTFMLRSRRRRRRLRN
jgi:hypothetical protein